MGANQGNGTNGGLRCSFRNRKAPRLCIQSPPEYEFLDKAERQTIEPYASMASSFGELVASPGRALPGYKIALC